MDPRPRVYPRVFQTGKTVEHHFIGEWYRRLDWESFEPLVAQSGARWTHPGRTGRWTKIGCDPIGKLGLFEQGITSNL
jgi:hypothetical protein